MKYERIIVTVCIRDCEFDLEVPVKQTIGSLVEDICQVLTSYQPNLYIAMTGLTLFGLRLNRKLNVEETLYDEGIWQGDILRLEGTALPKKRPFPSQKNSRQESALSVPSERMNIPDDFEISFSE